MNKPLATALVWAMISSQRNQFVYARVSLALSASQHHKLSETQILFISIRCNGEQAYGRPYWSCEVQGIYF